MAWQCKPFKTDTSYFCGQISKMNDKIKKMYITRYDLNAYTQIGGY